MDINKYQYSMHIPTKYYKKTHIGYATQFNDLCYVVTTGKHNSLLKCTSNNGQLIDCTVETPCCESGKLDFLNIIRNDLFYIPQNKWNILSLHCKDRYVYCSCDNINLQHDILDAIFKSYPKTCKCHECYRLFGFLNLHNFTFFVQLDCKHKNGKQVLYLVKADIDLSTLQCQNLLATNEYNYSNLLFDNGIQTNECNNFNFNFNGVYHDNNKIYLSSRCGKYSYLWCLEYFYNLNYVASPVLVAKLRKTPRGMFRNANRMIVMVDNIKNKKLRYYTLESPLFC